ncbi:SMAD/FHA domain-containing protein [Backusella circina FSU 941]|nr:SMAD/FHA domain-containing protein [Backusella circina FSU 941]
MTSSVYFLRIVPHLDSSHSLVFPVMEYTLQDATILKMGRTTDKRLSPVHMTFRSKVVSRRHAEIWIEQGKFYIRDTQSSSGTFVNNRRLSQANRDSAPVQLNNNDIIQLGVDYQGGTQELYRCVKMRLELNRNENTMKYNIQSFHSLRNLNRNTDNTMINDDDQEDDIHIDECCICLFAIAPFQALFVTPCSHSFHFKCIRPLLDNYPGFSCPLCRNYADLENNVAVEVDEVKQILESMNKGEARS